MSWRQIFSASQQIYISTYLQRSSCHPWHIKKATSYREAFRLRRIYSDEDKFRTRSETLDGCLVHREYNENFIREQVARTSRLDREVLIKQENGRSESSKERTPMVVTFHLELNEIKNIVSRLQTILDASEEHKRVFKDQPLVAFRHAPNLKDSLVRSKPPGLQTGLVKGSFSCGKSRCQIYKFMKEVVNLSCNGSGRESGISRSFTCDS